jgi:hypothetical protein
MRSDTKGIFKPSKTRSTPYWRYIKPPIKINCWCDREPEEGMPKGEKVDV